MDEVGDELMMHGCGRSAGESIFAPCCLCHVLFYCWALGRSKANAWQRKSISTSTACVRTDWKGRRTESGIVCRISKSVAGGILAMADGTG